MNELRLLPDRRWLGTKVTIEWLNEKAEWLCRDTGSPGGIDSFFETAARLMRLCGYDYLLLGSMFFHVVIGLEAMLRVHFKSKPEDGFRSLLERAVREGVITDATFSEIRPLPKAFKDHFDEKLPTHAQRLAELLPALRNEYFHGSCWLHPEFVHLALQVREMADALTISRKPDGKAIVP